MSIIPPVLYIQYFVESLPPGRTALSGYHAKHASEKLARSAASVMPASGHRRISMNPAQKRTMISAHKRRGDLQGLESS